MKSIMPRLSKRAKIGLLLLAVTLFSMLILYPVTTSQAFQTWALQSLDENKVNVMRLTALSASASTAITFLPGDVGSPIAEQLAELSSYLLIVLAVIALQKALVILGGFISFVLLIPCACLLGIVSLHFQQAQLKTLAMKLATFGLALFLAICASIQISSLLDNAHQQSVEQSIVQAEQNTEYIEDMKGDLAQEDKHWWENVGEYISNVTSSIGNSLRDMVKKGEDTLNAMVDAIATMFITCCVVPIALLLFLVWLTKFLFRVDVYLDRLQKLLPQRQHPRYAAKEGPLSM